MPLPKRKLPSLDNDFNSVNNLDEFEEIQELTDDDFITEDSDFEQIKQNESSSYVQDELEEMSEPEVIEEVKSKPKKEKKGRIKPKKKKFDFNFDYTKLNKKHYFIIAGVFVAFLIIFTTFSLLTKPKNNTSNSTSTKVEQKENKTDVKYKFKKETSGGIIFDVSSEKSTKINLQRLFYDNKGNIILCESGDIEIIKGSQEVFTECLNNKDSTDVKDTEKHLIKDNLTEIKE